MTAHSGDPEAGSAVQDGSLDSAADAFDNYFAEHGDALAEENNEDEQGASADDEDALNLDDEEDGDDEPDDSPAIETPVSLTAEEKAKFAALPKEAQKYVADLESRRAIQVQTATTKASEAQRQAETRAAQADAQAQARYAQQLKAFADHLAPKMPDQQLAYTDPATYMALQAQYTADKAQHDDFVQQVSGLEQDAQTRMSESQIAERDAELMTIPEVMNTETREGFFKAAIDEGQKLGLDMSQINFATAKELKALREISILREKAGKYDTAMAKQMQRVRSARSSPSAKPNAAGKDGKGFAGAMDRLRESGSLEDAARAFARLG